MILSLRVDHLHIDTSQLKQWSHLFVICLHSNLLATHRVYEHKEGLWSLQLWKNQRTKGFQCFATQAAWLYWSICFNSLGASHDNWCIGTLILKQDNYSTVGEDGGCRVGEVRAGTTSPMPDHKGLSYSNCQRSAHSISEQISEI